MIKSIIRCLVTILALCCVFSQGQLNNQPIIGILTTPSDITDVFDPKSWSYLPGSYISFIEGAGGRVIPIPFDASYENLTYFFNRINGLLLPGGGANLYLDNPAANSRVPSQVTAAAFFLFDLAVQANDNGNYFPVWVTCQGFEIFMMWASKSLFFMDNVTDSNVVRNVSFTFDSKKSRLFSDMPEHIKNAMSTQAITYYTHQNMMTPEKFYTNEVLIQNYSISAISYGSYGRWYLAAIEAKKYPFYGNQFHPEKNAYEWLRKINAPHSYVAVQMEQYFSNFFVNEARKNFNAFKSFAAMNASLIYNFGTYVPGPTHSFSYVYMFPYVNSTPSFWPNLFNPNYIDTN